MPRPKSSKVQDLKTQTATVPSPKRPIIHKINDVLSILFHLIWIAVGLYILLVISSQIKQGVLTQLLAPQARQSQASEVETPTETDLPGIGKVNIACVKSALKPESIQKLLQKGDTSALEGEEKTNFEACIVEKETLSPEQ